MGLAQDAILTAATNPSTGANTAPAAGDSLTVRNFPVANPAYLEGMIRMGTTAGYAQVRSPLLHDNVQGIRITPGESPSLFSLPAEVQQTVQPQDQFITSVSGGAGEVDIVILLMYYSNLGGAQARFINPGDLNGNILYARPIQVAVTTGGTAGTWTDTVITTTENLLHANKDYAVLGYTANTALGFVGLKGIDTANLRVGGPGSTQEFPVSNYFVTMSQRTGRPHIPVFNSANKDSTYVSTCAATASVAAVVELNCVELVRNISQVG